MLLFGYSTFFDIFAVEYAIIYTITVFNMYRIRKIAAAYLENDTCNIHEVLANLTKDTS